MLKNNIPKLTNKIQRFFTLIELIVVIVVLGILAAIIIPNVADHKNDSIKAMIESNTRILQLGSDMYSLKNNSTYPTILQPKFGSPKYVDINLLSPDYLKSKPELSKEINQKYWVDNFGQVWGSTVESPNNAFSSEEYLEWSTNKEIEAYRIYEANTSISGKASNSPLKFVKEIKATKETDKIKVEKLNKEILVSSIDKYGLESAPAGPNNQPMSDWFTPIIGKDGSYNFSIADSETMYWDGFSSYQYTPQGTSIDFSFSYKQENGDFSPFTQDFASIPPSTELKIRIEMKGNNGVFPSLYNVIVRYHYKDDMVNKTSILKQTNLTADGRAINEEEPVTVTEEYILPLDKVIKDIKNSDSYNPLTIPSVSYSYKEPNSDQFVPILSITDVPRGSTIQIEREYENGKDLLVQPTLIELVDRTNVASYTLEEDNDLDPIINDPEWKTVDTQSYFTHSGNNQAVHWISADIKDTIPEGTRILYRYSTSNNDGWSKEVEEISNVHDSRSLRLRAILQVRTSEYGKVQEPSIQSIRIVHERGYSDLSLVQPTLMIIPEKGNNVGNPLFSTTTKVNWTYEAVDPRNKKIVNIEWTGDIRTQYTTPGTYQVKARVLNESNYWSEWYIFDFEVKEETPIAVIDNNREYIQTGVPVIWNSNKSFDPDSDGIIKVEWDGKKEIYDVAGNYSIRLRVQDSEGNWSNWVTKDFEVIQKPLSLYKIEAENPIVSNSSQSSPIVNNAEASGGKVSQLWSNTGYSIGYKFTGTAIDIVYYDSTGSFSISVDGQKRIINRTGTNKFVTTTFSQLTDVQHTLTVNYISGNVVWLDYFEVYGLNANPNPQVHKTTILGDDNTEQTLDVSFIEIGRSNAKIYYSTDKNATAEIFVKDSSNQTIRNLGRHQIISDNSRPLQSIVWDGKDNNGLYVTEGNYEVVINTTGVDNQTVATQTKTLKGINMTSLTKVEAESSAVTATRNFYGSDVNASGGQYRTVWSNTSDSASFKFNGTGVTLTYLDNKGESYVSIDGASYPVLIRKDSGKYLKMSIQGLPSGTHTISIRHKTGGATHMDYFEVTP